MADYNTTAEVRISHDEEQAARLPRNGLFRPTTRKVFGIRPMTQVMADTPRFGERRRPRSDSRRPAPFSLTDLD